MLNCIYGKNQDESNYKSYKDIIKDDSNNPIPSYAIITTCSSCKLGRMPLLLQVVKKQIKIYKNISVDYVYAHLPIINFYNDQDEIIELYSPTLLIDIDHDDFLIWLKEYFNFELILKEVNIPQTIETINNIQPFHTKIVSNYKYEYYKERALFKQASTFAQLKGGYLAIILNEEENKLIMDLTREEIVEILNNGNRANRIIYNEVWLGGQDRYYKNWTKDTHIKSNFHWTSGFGPSLKNYGKIDDQLYTNWDISEPSNNNNIEHCMAINERYKWIDISCLLYRPFIVQYTLDETQQQQQQQQQHNEL